MPQIKPDFSRVWASNAPGDHILDPDDWQTGKYEDGWVFEEPFYQHMNYVQNFLNRSVAYFNEQGIPEWDNATEYPPRAYVKGSDGLIYKALQGNTGVDPTTDGGTNWEEFGSGGAGGGARSGFWQYATDTTMVDPGAGNFRSDAAPNASTQLAFNINTDNEIDAKNILDTIQEHDVIYLQDAANSSNWVRYRVTSDATDNTTWFQISVAFEDGEGSVAKGAQMLVRFAYSTGITAVEWQSGGVPVLSSGIANFSANFTVADAGGVANFDLSDSVDIQSGVRNLFEVSVNGGRSAHMSGGSWTSSYWLGIGSTSSFVEFDGVFRANPGVQDLVDSISEQTSNYGILVAAANSRFDGHNNTIQFDTGDKAVVDMNGQLNDPDDGLGLVVEGHHAAVKLENLDRTDQAKLSSFSTVDDKSYHFIYDGTSDDYFAFDIEGSNGDSAYSFNILQSSDAVSWSSVHSENFPIGTRVFFGQAASSGSDIAAVLDQHVDSTDVSSCICIYSNDSGANWNLSTIANDFFSNLNINSGPNGFVTSGSDEASGATKIYHSTNGASWADVTPFPSDVFGNVAIASTSTHYVLLYQNGAAVSESHPDLYSINSTDGINWSSPVLVLDTMGGDINVSPDMFRASYENDTVLFVGRTSSLSTPTPTNGGFTTWSFRSTDNGANWTSGKILNGSFGGLNYVGGKFYCTGHSNGLYAFSDDDGLTFDVRTSRAIFTFTEGATPEQPYGSNGWAVYKANAYTEAFFGGPRVEKPHIDSSDTDVNRIAALENALLSLNLVIDDAP